VEHNCKTEKQDDIIVQQPVAQLSLLAMKKAQKNSILKLNFELWKLVVSIEEY